MDLEVLFNQYITQSFNAYNPPSWHSTSDEVIVTDANLVSDDIMEIQYEYGENFVEVNPNTNVIMHDCNCMTNSIC